MNKWQVLIVEDEEKIRSVVERYLTHNDYDVITAADGETAMYQAKKYRPDLIVLDIMLPDMNGFDILKKMRKIDALKEIPVIFLSGLQEAETVIEGLEIGADDYIIKPFDPNILVAKINVFYRRLHPEDQSSTENIIEIFEQLTYQERKILQWIEKGYTNKEIADKLKLTEGTIKVYNHNIFQKLQVKNRTQAIVRAKEVDFL